MSTYNVLIMGASYGSLLAIKLLFAGNRIKLVCLPAEAEAINKEGVRVRLPIKGRKDLVEIESRKLPGSLSAEGPGAVNPSDYDLVALAMQEPQYRSSGVRELLSAGRRLPWRIVRPAGKQGAARRTTQLTLAMYAGHIQKPSGVSLLRVYCAACTGG